MKHLIKFNEDKGVYLYYFNPNDYGEEYFVLSSSQEEALQSVILFLKEKMSEDVALYREDYNMWRNSTVKNLPYKYTIDVYQYGQVVQSEIS